MFPALAETAFFSTLLGIDRPNRRRTPLQANPSRSRAWVKQQAVMDQSELDRWHMQRALDLARQGEGYVEPNPMVGCVIVQGAEIIGEGWHRRFSEAMPRSRHFRSPGNGPPGPPCT